MRYISTTLTNSLTASTKTEMFCVRLEKSKQEFEYYFVEHPTNLIPNIRKLKDCKSATQLTSTEWQVLSNAFEKYLEVNKELAFVHPPTFVIAYCIGSGVVDLESRGILYS